MASVIHTTHAPAAVGPYSQAMDCGEFVFCSGQIPLVPETGLMVEGGIEAQSRQMFSNIQAVLNAAFHHETGFGNQRNLAGAEDEIAAVNCLRVGADSGRCIGGVNNVSHVKNLLTLIVFTYFLLLLSFHSR